MIKPKPLTKEELEVIDNRCAERDYDSEIEVHLLLAAEAYWRNAVKTADVTEPDGECLDGECPFCSVDRYDSVPHKPDCPWALAQDSEVSGD